MKYKLTAQLEDGDDNISYFFGDYEALMNREFDTVRDALAAAQSDYLGQDDDGCGVIVGTFPTTNESAAAKANAIMAGVRLDG